MNRRELVVICSFFLLASTVLGAYAGTIGVNDLFGFTNGYGFTDLNSTNVNAGTEFYRDGVNYTQFIETLIPDPEETASYLIWKDGATYFAKNGSTGAIDYTGTNASGVIQDAIDSTTSQTQGGIVYIKGEDYALATTIIVKSKVSLVGDGSNYGPHFVDSGTLATSFIQVPGAAVGVRIEGIRIVGNGIADGLMGIQVQSGATYVKIENCRVATIEKAIFASNTAGLRIENVDTMQFGVAGIHISNSHSNVVIYGGSHGNVIPDGHLLSGDAIRIENSKNINVRDVGVYGANYGVHVLGSKEINLDNIFAHVNAVYGIWVEEGSYSVNIVNSRAINNNQNNETFGSGISIGQGSDASFTRNCTISNNFIYDEVGRFASPYNDTIQRRGIWLSNKAAGNKIHDNTVYNNTVIQIKDDGFNNKIYQNSGFPTENSGTGSITSGGTTDVITHGLAYTPSAGDITITLTENPTNTPGAIWVSAIGATQFTVNCENDPGASNLDFSWHVIRID